MATRSWKKDRAEERIKLRLEQTDRNKIEIRDYVRNTDLENIPSNVAYRVDGVHLYADILNMAELLAVTTTEGEVCHRRTLRFLNLHYRAVHRVLQKSEAIQVDFHNQRLHAVVAKPYGDEVARLHRAIAIASLVIDVLEKTGENADHPAARVRVGIDSGAALAVNNGRRGHREPLFLGAPANLAAKRAAGGTATGIYLTNTARKVLGLAAATNPDSTPLSSAEISTSCAKARLGITADEIVADWKSDLENNPIGTFEFSAHTPPFATLDFEELSAKNSRRQDALSLYADIDGFTAFVGRNISYDDSAKKVVQTLHVIRSELDAVLHEDFSGRKVRFIGDCVHGLLVEGTAQTTDAQETISNAILCAGGMRSSFSLALRKLSDGGVDVSGLGLAIGLEYGPMNATRLGIKGELIRCSVSRGVLASEAEQLRCSGSETAIGVNAHAQASEAVRTLFDANRKKANLEYDAAVNGLANAGDKAARAAKAQSSSLLKAASVASAPLGFQNRPAGPVKPAGFA